MPPLARFEFSAVQGKGDFVTFDTTMRPDVLTLKRSIALMLVVDHSDAVSQAYNARVCHR